MAKTRTEPCIFCDNPRTTKRGEHLIDDWLNRLDGKRLRDKYDFTELNEYGDAVHSFATASMDATRPVVCDVCNHGWMSDLTNETKKAAEGFIRFNRPVTLLPLGLRTIATLAFMKAAVIDAADHPTPLLTRAVCLRFARSFEMPRGTQAWLARFNTPHKMAARIFTTQSTVKSSQWFSHKFYGFTYAVGHMAIQMLIPGKAKWAGRKHREPPFLIQASHWDIASVPIWPEATYAEWPSKFLDDESLKLFRDRIATDMRARRA